jgi:hypothetical protein
LLRLGEDDAAEIRGLYEGLEIVVDELSGLRGDVAGLDFKPQLQRSLGDLEDLMVEVSQVAEECGVSV